MKDVKSKPKEERLFVNLRTDAFVSFAQRGKTYEFRDYSRRFNEDNIRRDVRVELRNAYNRGSLWGKIGRVFMGSVDYIYDRVGDYSLIEPREESLESALDQAKKTAKNPKMCIAFEVIFEDKSIN